MREWEEVGCRGALATKCHDMYKLGACFNPHF